MALFLNTCALNVYAHGIYEQNSQILDIIARKIILCTGPAYGKRQELISITNQDRLLIPFKKIFVITNDKTIADIMFDGVPTIDLYFTARGKQMDCLNCIIHSIIQVAADQECLDDDIILFKHESVYINDMFLVTRAINKIMQGYDMVAKFWVGQDIHNEYNFPDYYHTDSFFLSVKAARAIAKDLQELSAFTQDFHFCEEYFTKYIVNKLSRVYKIDYHHSSWKDNELGLYHIPRYEEPADWYWDKKNYESIYS